MFIVLGFWEYPLCNANVGFSYESECSLLYRNANKQYVLINLFLAIRKDW